MFQKTNSSKLLVILISIIFSSCVHSGDVENIWDDRLSADDIKIVQEAITEGANVNSKDDRRFTPLMIAATYDSVEIGKLLIDNGADLNAKNQYGNTALIISILSKSLETAKLLIEADADLNIQNNLGNTALILAEAYNRNDIIKLIKDRMEKRKKEVQNYLSDPDAQILPQSVSNIINEYL